MFRLDVEVLKIPRQGIRVFACAWTTRAPSCEDSVGIRWDVVPHVRGQSELNKPSFSTLSRHQAASCFYSEFGRWHGQSLPKDSHQFLDFAVQFFI